MREASFGDELFGSDTENMYRDLHDAQLALTMARGQGMGLSDLIVRALTPAVAANTDSSQAAVLTPSMPPVGMATPPMPLIASSNNPVIVANAAAADAQASLAFAEPAAEASLAAAPLPEHVAPTPLAVIPHAPVDVFATREDFVRAIAPHARAAAEKIGVAPEAIIAHAALESNFGRNVPRQPDGTSSFNFFGVKATARWEGASARVQTLESEGGVMTRRVANFRAYGSMTEGFADYARLISKSPRYQAARAAGENAIQYFQGLADSGYATDPDYAGKLSGVLRGDAFRAVLKNAAGLPLNG
jgi:flagellar protein FlgJ